MVEDICFAIGTEINNSKSNYNNYTVRSMLVLIILFYMYFSHRGWVLDPTIYKILYTI